MLRSDSSPDGKNPTGIGELLDAIIVAVRDVEVPVLIESHPIWRMELAGTGSLPAPASEQLSGRRELEYLVSEAIGHIQIAVAGYRDTEGSKGREPLSAPQHKLRQPFSGR